MEMLNIMLTQGGVPTWFIVLSSILLVVVGAERFYVLYVAMSFNTQDAIEKIRSSVLEKNYGHALQICDLRPGAPDLQVLRTALVDVESGREAMRSALGSSLIELSAKTEKRLPLIALIASVATLLGLLGTITGLMKTFAALAEADPTKKGEVLGAGISEAMYSTAAGLTVGIVALVMHSVYLSRSNAIRTHAKNTGLKVINWIEKSERS